MSSLAKPTHIYTALRATRCNTVNDGLTNNFVTKYVAGDVAVNPMRKFETTGFTKLAKVNSGNFNA